MIQKLNKSKKALKHPKSKTQDEALAKTSEVDIFRDINKKSFSNNFMILIQHYKKQLAQNPPKTEVL